MIASLRLMSLLIPALLAAEGYAFPADRTQWYRLAMEQQVEWTSAGDELHFTTSILWDFALQAERIDGDLAVVRASITRIVAALDGPAAAHRFDSRKAGDEADPLFGGLAAQAGTTLGLTVHQPSGRVVAVSGTEELIARLEARTPGAVPGRPGPYADAIRAAFGPEALAAWWTEILALPTIGDGPVLIPGQESLSAMVRTWGEQGRFQLSLPDPAPRVTLAEEPTPVQALVRSCSGEGQVSVVDGMPGPRTTRIELVLAVDALTQPVAQKHLISWALAPIPRAQEAP